MGFRHAFFLLSLTLQAQVWQDPQTLVTEKVERLRSYRAYSTFERGPGGERLDFPNQLNRLAGHTWDVLDGQLFVFGAPYHPAYDLLLQMHRKQAKAPFSIGELVPIAIHRSRDFKTWEYLGRYLKDGHGLPETLHPLRNGRFLATGGPFLDGAGRSSLARYRLDAQKTLRFESLIDAGWGQAPLASRERDFRWEFHRCASGLVALDRVSGWLLILDATDGHVTKRLQLEPESAGLNAARPLVVAAHPAPDGTLLLALRPVPGREDRWATASTQQAFALLYPLMPVADRPERGAFNRTKFDSGHSERDLVTRAASQGLRWHRLDPGRQTLAGIPPPPMSFRRLRNPSDLRRLGLRVEPDGSVVQQDDHPPGRLIY